MVGRLENVEPLAVPIYGYIVCFDSASIRLRHNRLKFYGISQSRQDARNCIAVEHIAAFS